MQRFGLLILFIVEFNKISLNFEKTKLQLKQNCNYQNKNWFQPVTNYKKRSEFTNWKTQRGKESKNLKFLKSYSSQRF